MAFRHGSRVSHTSNTAGTGTLTLIAPGTDRQTFTAAFGAGPVKVFYFIQGSTYFEVGVGTYDGAGPTLARDTVLVSSNSGSAVSLPAAMHDVCCWEPALWPVQAITGTTNLAIADLFGQINFTGSSASSLNLPAIASLPAGIAFPVTNLGTAVLTIDPNSSETINGATTLALLPGESAWVFYRDTATAQWVAIHTNKRRARNAQTGTSYTYLLSDGGKHVTHSNGSAIAGTLPQASATTFADGWEMFVENIGAGLLTITPTTSNINGGTALVLRQYEWAIITSDGTHYRAKTNGQITGLPLAREIGTRGIPQNIQDAAYGFVLSDAGGQVYKDSASARTWTIPANASVAFPIGTAITLINGVGAGNITLAITSDTLRRGDGIAGTGSRTILPNSIATIVKTKSTEWMISGAFT